MLVDQKVPMLESLCQERNGSVGNRTYRWTTPSMMEEFAMISSSYCWDESLLEKYRENVDR